MKNFFKKVKKLFIKIFTDKKTNNSFLGVNLLILLVIGYLTKVSGLFLYGAFSLSVINTIIVKVVSARVNNNKPINNKKGGSANA